MKIEQAMGDSQLIVLIDPLADKFSDEEAEKSQNGMQILYGTYKQFLLKFCPNDSHMSPKKHSENLKTWFHT